MPPLEGDDEVTERERIKILTLKKTIKESSGIVCTKLYEVVINNTKLIIITVSKTFNFDLPRKS